ncbi:MAG TPA: hypothetical protein VIL36_17440 [Acidimicrobiales bacterium]
MRTRMVEWQRRIGAWAVSRAGDDRGAVSTETAIITALLGVAAVGLATFLAGNILDWQGTIPTP